VIRLVAPFIALLVSFLALPSGRQVHADDLSGADVAFFENRIRPVLVKHCLKCHSAKSKELGGKLLLDSRAGVRAGGESGPALVAGDAKASLIVQAMRYDGLEMPPDGPLPESIVSDFAKWVRLGAADPRTDKPEKSASPPGETTAASSPDEVAKRLWSLKPVGDPTPPAVKDSAWVRDPLDRFVLARIEAAGFAPSEDADARALVRRLFHDIVGLPPSMTQVEQFVEAHRVDEQRAIEQLVDQLLSSSQFGERWGRHWLDVARFAESNGNDGLGRNPTFPHAWRYRDYVIDCFNRDTPFAEFLKEQIAGDLLKSETPEERDRRLIATGFLAMAAKPAKAMNNNFDMDVVADQIDVIGRGVMGLSVACARCHDHKFDPIHNRDYYAIAGIFTSTETLWGVAANEKLTAPPTGLHVLKSATKVLPPEGFVETVLVLQSDTGVPKKIPKPPWPVGTPLAMGVRDRAKPADCKINIKGDAKKLGKPAPRGFLQAIPIGAETGKIAAKQSGRVELANWLTHEDHPLTSRVMVNRIWHHLFGQGIVRTPDDFGVYGDRPSHPKLLDHLATRFVAQGWSIKRLIRDIALSRTYQLGCKADAGVLEADAENRLFARRTRHRLGAEALRDNMLHVAGQLDSTAGDATIIRHRDILVNLAGNLHQPSHYRSVYLCYLRNAPPPELTAFDLPDFSSVTGRRDESTSPSQALHVYNSPFVIAQAGHFAKRVIEESADNESRVRFAFRRVFRREPTVAEMDNALELVRLTESEADSEVVAWSSLCQALLSTNEFRYID